jgi:hypothetical protein
MKFLTGFDPASVIRRNFCAPVIVRFLDASTRQCLEKGKADPEIPESALLY